MTAPDRIVLYRRIMSDEWHLAEAGETMSHANAEYAEYTRATPAALSPEVRALVEAASNYRDAIKAFNDTSGNMEPKIVRAAECAYELDAALRGIGGGNG